MKFIIEYLNQKGGVKNSGPPQYPPDSEQKIKNLNKNKNNYIFILYSDSDSKHKVLEDIDVNKKYLVKEITFNETNDDMKWEVVSDDIKLDHMKVLEDIDVNKKYLVKEITFNETNDDMKWEVVSDDIKLDHMKDLIYFIILYNKKLMFEIRIKQEPNIEERELTIKHEKLSSLSIYLQKKVEEMEKKSKNNK
jgi:hypothetical protein